MVNITIFDWDDTLFPTTSYLINKKQNYKLLDKLVYNILSYYLTISDVYIVTNASIKWVYISSLLIPNTQKLLKSKIKILSGRDIYSHITLDSYAWKKLLFTDIIKHYDLSKINNIISIGDADYEYKALINLYNLNKNNHIKYKNIKLLKGPNANILFDQLQLLYNTRNYIINYDNHLDSIYKYKNIPSSNKDFTK